MLHLIDSFSYFESVYIEVDYWWLLCSIWFLFGFVWCAYCWIFDGCWFWLLSSFFFFFLNSFYFFDVPFHFLNFLNSLLILLWKWNPINLTKQGFDKKEFVFVHFLWITLSIDKANKFIVVGVIVLLVGVGLVATIIISINLLATILLRSITTFKSNFLLLFFRFLFTFGVNILLKEIVVIDLVQSLARGLLLLLIRLKIIEPFWKSLLIIEFILGT